MDMCPPGFVVEGDPHGQCCLFGAQKWYEAINYCDYGTFTAKLAIGKWAGYVNGSSNGSGESALEFYTAQCPFGYGSVYRTVPVPNVTALKSR